MGPVQRIFPMLRLAQLNFPAHGQVFGKPMKIPALKRHFSASLWTDTCEISAWLLRRCVSMLTILMSSILLLTLSAESEGSIRISVVSLQCGVQLSHWDRHDAAFGNKCPRRLYWSLVRKPVQDMRPSNHEDTRFNTMLEAHIMHQTRTQALS